jgi:predicted adenine nucleotide alpha hydrolase (AANH) superfamily ATPase
VIGQSESSVNGTVKDAGISFGDASVLRPAILLHTCCGPCLTAVVEQLASRFRITAYFCNSNIDEEAEYLKRLEALRQYITGYNASVHMNEPVSLICAPYAPSAFLSMIKGTEACEEGGERCLRCISDRLEKTASFAAMNGYEFFSTTLSVSRHKSYSIILEFGRALALKYGLSFVDDDFKQGGGDLRAALLAKSYGLYRQNFCGCSFSKK